jgi:thiol-disulfide isomerase/thioredoxin
MRLIGLLIGLVGVVLANEGKMLFEKQCMSCHTPFISMSKLKENFLDHNNTLLNLKAPTLNQLSYRLKQRIGDPKGDNDLHRMEVTAFMSDYVYTPDKDKSVCLEDVLQHFKTMPSLKGKVTEDELEEIGTYLYDFDNAVVKDKSVKYEGFDKALQDAKLEHKIIMIKVMTKECHYCRKMEREVMIESDVVNAIKKDFIPVAIDISVHKLPLGLKAEVTPSFIFIDESEKVIMNVPGAWSKEDFISLLKEAKLNTQKDTK